MHIFFDLFGGLLLLGSAGPRWAAAAIAMYVAAALLFLSALESARRVQLPRTLVDDPMPKALITSGPFALVRHPCYIAYSLAWLAAPVATHGPVITLFGLMAVATYILGAVAAPVAINSVGLTLIAVTMIVLTVIAAVREERVWLRSARAASYRAYRTTTGMFLPFIGRG